MSICTFPLHSSSAGISLSQIIFTGVFYFLSSTINPILYSVMSKRFRRAFRDKLCRYRSCCLCLCCSDVVIIGGAGGGGGGGGVGGIGSASDRMGHGGGLIGGIDARRGLDNSQSTTTRQKLLKTYGKNQEPHSFNLASSIQNKRPMKELCFAGK